MAAFAQTTGEQQTPPQPRTQAAPTPPQAGSAAGQTVTVVGCIQGETDTGRRTTSDEVAPWEQGSAPATSSSSLTPGWRRRAPHRLLVPRPGTTGAAAQAYELTGANEGKASQFAGKRVEITGMLKPAETAGAAPTGGPTAGAPPRGVDVASEDLKLRELEVTSVRETTGTCPAK